ncbi:DUF2283 domain-containing protein [Cohnella fermenti]|uniref:DUF2283 domain-containing protein n=1 Tax=Cohnella fermenti TaxID=2565925 RepID=A0A4S4CCP9_9BACL|nr:DUF2283 domain-containing protein [Cohnella fermenti]THF83732.1 DUF2283 domain-containing protein [Cohnella fermenti]
MTRKKQSIQFKHDKTGDVMYIVFGDNRPSYSDDVGDGIYARYDMETDTLIGITILDYSKRLKGEVFDLIVSEKIVADDDQGLLDFLH